MTTLLIFILILFLVVIGHEFGHFIVARWCGVRVEEFGFGFPPKLLGYKPTGSDTEYSINLLPIGGFVRLYGEEGDHAQDPYSFSSKRPLAKIAILIAGVVVNLIIAFIAFTIVGLMGNTMLIDETERNQVTDPRVLITAIAPNSPAEEGGIRFGDEIISINQQPVTRVDQVIQFIEVNQGKTIEVVLERGDSLITKQILVRENPPADEGAVGIALSLAGTKYVSLGEAMIQSFQRISMVFIGTFSIAWIGIQSIFDPTLQLPPEAAVTGPVGLVQVVGDFRELGFSYLITLTGLISTSLALFNMLPIPALDGGRIVFAIIEMIKGKPLNRDLEAKIHMTGYVVLLGLMIFVTIKDIMNLL